MDNRYNTNYLYFEEGPHKYTDTCGNEYISVTTLLGKYYPKFDEHYWLRKKAKEQGLSTREIKKQWETIKNEACDRGSKTHNKIEDSIKNVSKFKEAIKYLNQTTDGRCITVADIPNLNVKPLDVAKFKDATDNKYPEIYRVFEFYVERGYTIYSEIGVYLIDYLISGTIDILCIKDTDFVILDWKTNRDGLKFEAGYYKKDKKTIPNQLTNEWVRKDEKMLPPLSHLDNCNGEHYTMQLSLYAIAVELILGIPCTGLGLCHIGSPFILNKYGQPLRDKTGYHIDPNGQETTKWYRIPYRRNEAIAILKDVRIKIVANNNINTELNLFN